MPSATVIRDEIASAVPGLSPVSRGMPTRPTEEGDDDETIAGLPNSLLIRDPGPVFGIRPNRKVPGRYRTWDVFDAKGKIVRASTDLFDAMMWLQQFASVNDPSTSVIDSPAIGADLAAINAKVS